MFVNAAVDLAELRDTQHINCYCSRKLNYHKLSVGAGF